METIRIYLENMFKGLPQTEEIKRLKSDILSNMEDKYKELKEEGKPEHEVVGIVISEFGNIDELLEEMNIKTAEKENTYPEMSLEEAKTFVSLKDKTSRLVGLGVTLILIGVSQLVFLTRLMEQHYIFEGLSENAQTILPVIFLFLFIAPAVGLFIYSGMSLEKYKYIEEGSFELSRESKAALEQERSVYTGRRSLGTITGVLLCVLSPLAVFIFALFGGGFAVYGVSVLLIMVATAVFIFITTSSVPEAYKRLLKLEEYAVQYQQNNKVIGAIAGIVWPLVVCIFLFCGFVFNLWYICWIIFPITGILFGGFCAFYNALKSR